MDGHFFRCAAGGKGFSLPELLITIILISILFALAIVFSSSLRQTRKLRDYEIAIALAQQAIEILRGAPFSTLDDADAGSESLEADFNTDSGPGDQFVPVFITNNIRYERKVEVTEAPSSKETTPGIGLKCVRVSVKWFTPTGEDIQPFEIVTTIADCN